ncbi:hypothetical protein SAMN05421594_1236 [Chryseobacterium oleae]|uniref:Uncharacterized protein n=1 Tax=Chryseobacterium oleae TaxID=491207 RepID=A0A1I4WJV9_CHROL|nr:hypothetical protein [Chryseobacterium oleae]SFN13259.1 hypothetical protein SAMN05421594_1236 [Chryseobacterium oleae]
MGFNCTGILINSKADEQIMKTLFDSEIAYLKEVNFEEATDNFRDENTVDMVQTETGTLIITGLGQIYDISDFDGEIIQFMISDISDTYYFEKYKDKVLERKYIYSQGEIAEDEGSGIIRQDEDFTDQIWELADRYLQNNFKTNMFDQQFKRYKV